jgi:tRNA-Thr(GGU) m(6)t(6)A37 methyltransferase TsaA
VKQLPPSKKIEITPIGFVKRTSPSEDVKNKNLISKIVLKKNLTKALDSVENFSHIYVIFWLHKISATGKTVLKVHPRGKAELPLVGIFATRTPNRPNPIGLTLVELVKREENILWVKGLDAFDGTPVLDIKPYNCLDTAADFKVPRWLTKLKKDVPQS